jgi:flagellar hook assembly protein FlgD
MDNSIIAALSAILGSTVGGLTTFATTFLNQRYVTRREMLVKDVANREQLYSEFLKEVGNLYIDSLNRTLDDLSQQASIVTMYSLIGRIRMVSGEAVLTAAEKLAEDIIESYKRPPMTLQERLQLWGPADPWHEFTKACRAERESMLGRL